MENIRTFLEVFEVFEFQGWNDFFRISEDIYIGLLLAFYSTFVPTNGDNISFKSIVGSFEIQVLLFDIAQITNTPNEGILFRARERWCEELRALEDEVIEVLTSKRNMHVRDINTSHLLTNDRVVYSMVQHTVLPQSCNIYVMSEVDHMVMFCFMTRRRIDLVRLILDFMSGYEC